MSLIVRPISAALHSSFIEGQRSVSFLQTPAWGRVKAAWRSESLGWFDGWQLVGAGLVLHRPVPRLECLTLAYLAEGPTIGWDGEIGAWLDPLASYLEAHGAFALRVGPPVRTHVWSAGEVKAGLADPDVARLTDLPGGTADPVGARVTRQLREAGWLPQNPEDGFGSGHPQFTYELPLRHPDGRRKTADDLLAGMNQLWRRNIRRAEKEGVEVEVVGPSTCSRAAPVEALKAFHDLYVHTAERDHFAPRPLPYFETMFAELGAEGPDRIRLLLARHRGDLVAATVMIRVGTTAWYSYGASSSHKREVRASNAIQWVMIRDALEAGCDVYSLRGITPTLDADDPHAGLIRFKVGTGGEAVRYVGEWDLPLRPIPYRAFSLFMRGRERLRTRARRRPRPGGHRGRP